LATSPALGGHRAVGVMTDRDHALETVRLIAWLIDDIDDAFELVGLAVIGIGFISLAWSPVRSAARRVTWGRFPGSSASCWSQRLSPTQLAHSIWSICCSSSEAPCCFPRGLSGPVGSCANPARPRLRAGARGRFLLLPRPLASENGRRCPE
jgi:hypothetical protein